jgi:hypothetical protein
VVGLVLGIPGVPVGPAVLGVVIGDGLSTAAGFSLVEEGMVVVGLTLDMPGLTVTVLGPGDLVMLGLADIGAALGLPGGTVGPIAVGTIAAGLAGTRLGLPGLTAIVGG